MRESCLVVPPSDPVVSSYRNGLSLGPLPDPKPPSDISRDLHKHGQTAVHRRTAVARRVGDHIRTIRGLWSGRYDPSITESFVRQKTDVRHQYDRHPQQKVLHALKSGLEWVDQVPT